jgi:hypothetical protein
MGEMWSIMNGYLKGMEEKVSLFSSSVPQIRALGPFWPQTFITDQSSSEAFLNPFSILVCILVFV